MFLLTYICISICIFDCLTAAALEIMQFESNMKGELFQHLLPLLGKNVIAKFSGFL